MMTSQKQYNIALKNRLFKQFENYGLKKGKENNKYYNLKRTCPSKYFSSEDNDIESTNLILKICSEASQRNMIKWK